MPKSRKPPTRDRARPAAERQSLSNSEAASQAKDEGNKAFKDFKLLLAAQHYRKAEQLDPNNPIYPSNLSAALFEMGDYTECTSAILRCCSHLDFETQASLASRLSIRLAKSLSYAFSAGNAIQTAASESQITRIEQAAPHDGPASNVWSFWRSIIHTHDGPAVEVAKERLMKLPILKQVPFSSCEYFCISHDDVQSMLENSLNPGSTAGMDSIDLVNLPINRLPELAFLFGGVGDARHVFGTLIDLHETSRRMNQNRRSALRVHITLLDIKEHALARDLVVMVLLSKIMTCAETTAKLELQATVFYVYTAMVMPEYCHKRFCNTVAEIQAKLLQTGTNVLPWIRMDSRCTPAIQAVLQLWTTLPFQPTTHFVSRHKYSSHSDDIPFGLASESRWYSDVKAFLPPVEFWDRHPEIAASRQPTQSSRSKTNKAANHVKTTWVMNPTFFDDLRETNMDIMDGDTLLVVRQLAAFHQRHRITPFKLLEGSPAFGYVTGFFDCVIAAIKALDGKITLEFIHGDLQSELLRMRTLPALRQTSNLPVKYSKMWLSNVPDYINGSLGIALFVVPSLQDANSKASANHLLSFPAFMGEPTSFPNTYAHLAQTEFKSRLGCRVVYMAPMDVTILSPIALPLPHSDLATRDELNTWLMWIFLCTLINGRKNSVAKVITPSTIVTFIHLLVHLHKVGYPGHWLGGFLQNLVSNSVETDILPYTRALPISPHHDWVKGRPKARLRLEPWIPEIEAIVARTFPALPFALTLPAGFPAPGDIGLFSARIYPDREASVPDPVAGLVFVNPSKVRVQDVRDWQEHLLAVLRGDGAGKGMSAHICMVLSMEALLWDMFGEITWRMSRSRVKRMKTEGWKVAIFGTQEHRIISSFAESKVWKELT
ncbi:hypothetical protein DFH06DRAFT_1111847 [Mycena polygramma]|nr:hypothetical protein DFH06DRAFT_1111847 [Mycena polygramma]